jgi:hypothetical protein
MQSDGECSGEETPRGETVRSTMPFLIIMTLSIVIVARSYDLALWSANTMKS